MKFNQSWVIMFLLLIIFYSFSMLLTGLVLALERKIDLGTWNDFAFIFFYLIVVPAPFIYAGYNMITF